MEIAFTIKKIEVLRPIIFRSCNTLQEIQNFIEVLRLEIFRGCSTYFNELKFQNNQNR